MATYDFYIRQNDLLPELTGVTLTDENGTVLNLTGCFVRFHMRIKNTSGAPQVDKVATIVNAALGTVKYTWSGGDTATAGVYDAEFEVTFPDNRTETFPNDKNLQILVLKEVG